MKDCKKLYLSFVVLALLCFLIAPAVAADDAPTTPALKVAPIFLTCFTIKPVDPPKGEEPRSCDSYCMEKLAVCTGVQSNIGPPPACEDGMYKGHGNCRCCKVQQ